MEGAGGRAMGDAGGPRARRIAAGALAGLLALALAGAGCASNKPRDGCLRLEASDNLNLYDGQPHVVTLYIFPLASTAGFEGTGVNDLLNGAVPPGVVSNPVTVTVAPGEEDRSFRDTFPSETRKLGVVADYYRAPGDPEGTRTQVVRASCGWFRKPKLSLAAKDLYTK